MSNHTAADSQAELMLILHMIPGIQFPITNIEHTPTTVRITRVEGENFILNLNYRMLGNLIDSVTGIVGGKQVQYKVSITMSGCIKRVEAI